MLAILGGEAELLKIIHPQGIDRMVHSEHCKHYNIHQSYYLVQDINNGVLAIAQRLRAAGADLDIQDATGHTA